MSLFYVCAAVGGINRLKTGLLSKVVRKYTLKGCFLSTCRPSLFISVCLPLSCNIYVCAWTIGLVIKVHGEALSVLTINNLMLTFSLPPSPVSAHLPLSRSVSLNLNQLYVAGMLEVPGEPSLVPAIQTATLHLSTVPGLLKSATGKARHRSTLLNRARQIERRRQVTQQAQPFSYRCTTTTHLHCTNTVLYCV